MRERKENRRYLTTTQAARLAHLSPSTLLRAVQSKKLKAFSTPGGHFRIDPASLDAFFHALENGEKKRVLVVRLTPAERNSLLKRLRDDEKFTVSETAGGERPGVILLDTAPSAKGPRISAEDLHGRLRRWLS